MIFKYKGLLRPKSLRTAALKRKSPACAHVANTERNPKANIP